MIRLGRLLRRSVLRRPADDRELDDELRFHLGQEIGRRVAGGLSRAEAERTARLALGSAALVKERTRAVWVWTAFEQLVQDLRFGFRILTKSPALSVTAVVLVALVIGGNATVFSMAHGILAKPMPGVHPGGLVSVSWVADDGWIETHTTPRVYAHFADGSQTFASIAAFDFQRLTLMHENGSYAIRAGIVSQDYFETLGVRIVNGRGFTAEETARGTSGLVAVISHRLWQSTFQGADGIIGEPITLNGTPATVIGVAEPDFHGAVMAELSDLWLPLPARLDVDRGGVAMIGRLARGRSLREAHAELSTLWSQLQAADPAVSVFGLVPQKYKVRLVPYSATAGGNSLVSLYGYRILAIFSIVTLLTVLIVCANVANLLIARAVARQRELALRQSLGASRLRVVRGLIAEGLVLSAMAWIAACLFAWWVSRAIATYLIPAVAPGPVVYPALTPDWTVVGYALVLAVLCTLAVTIGPSLRTWRQPLLPFLKVGEQALVASRSKLSGGLVVLQMAFSVLLLTSAGLAHRSFALVNGTDVGFETHGILMATVNTAGAGTDGNPALVETLRDAVARLPEVESVSYVPGTRLSPWMDNPVRRERSSDPVLAGDAHVASDFFRTLGVPLVAGSDFRRGTDESNRAIVTRQLAGTLWPGESAVGKVLHAGPPDRLTTLEVIGVVSDAYFSGRVSEDPPRFVFRAVGGPTPPTQATFYIRHRTSLDAVAPAVARTLREADARVPIAALRSLDSNLATEQAPFWMLAILLSLFAGASLLVAAIGQYAVVAFEARRRTREFGLRIALGASAEQVVRSVLRDSFRLTAIGLAIGFALSAAVGVIMARFLYGITPTDPLTYLSVFTLLATASLVACYLPARRAARVDPLVALRSE